jgi:hypothetical protein
MAEQIRPKSNTDVRSRFTAQVKATAESAENMQKALRNLEQRKQRKVDKNGWDGDVFNIKDMNKPWDRKEIEEDVIKSIKDGDNPGVVGDLISSVTQGDWLATQERAFRARHQTKIRASMHAAARRRGHGHASGLFLKGLVNYVKFIVKQSKDIRK